MGQPVPDLTKPYSARERAYATVVLLSYWHLIEQLMTLVDVQPDHWSAGMRSLFPESVPGGPHEHPQQRLERWFAVYAEEIKILRTIRNQMVHLVDVSDADLRGANYLARVILATLFGVLPTEVDENWAKSKSAVLSREKVL